MAKIMKVIFEWLKSRQQAYREKINNKGWTHWLSPILSLTHGNDSTALHPHAWGSVLHPFPYIIPSTSTSRETVCTHFTPEKTEGPTGKESHLDWNTRIRAAFGLRPPFGGSFPWDLTAPITGGDFTLGKEPPHCVVLRFEVGPARLHIYNGRA